MVVKHIKWYHIPCQQEGKLFLGAKLFHAYVSNMFIAFFPSYICKCTETFYRWCMLTTTKVLKDSQGLTTYKTWQKRAEICYLTLSHPVSKHCVHSSMTTLSGLPRAARVAAWQCSTLHTVMSPSIRSFVSDLCQERQGGREDDWETARVTGRDTAWVWEILKKRTCKCRHKAKKDRQTENGWETVNLWERSANWFWFGKKKPQKGSAFQRQFNTRSTFLRGRH